MGFRDAYAVRPGFIQPMRGVTSPHTIGPLDVCRNGAAYPIIQKMFGRWVTSADLLAAAMLQLATAGSNKKALNTGDLNRLATQMGN
jgi:hypothetical protein